MKLLFFALIIVELIAELVVKENDEKDECWHQCAHIIRESQNFAIYTNFLCGHAGLNATARECVKSNDLSTDLYIFLQ